MASLTLNGNIPIDKIDSKHNVREIISLSNDLTVTGMGTKNNPYIIEGEI